MIYVTRKEHFNAAHRVYNPNWTEEKNLEVFGKCAHQHWHGHNFELHVTVKGTVNPDTGFVIDLKKLKDIIRDSVIEKLDHRNLNLDVDFLEGKMASTENLSRYWDGGGGGAGVVFEKGGVQGGNELVQEQYRRLLSLSNSRIDFHHWFQCRCGILLLFLRLGGGQRPVY